MNKLKQIENSIKKIPRGKIFLSDSLCKKYPIKNVSKVLAYLTRQEEIKRITLGLYVRPKKSRFLKGHLRMPIPEEIVKAVSKKTGEVISTYGAAAENYVGLTTQIQMRAIYYTTGRSRTIKISDINSIRLVHINHKKLIMPGTIVCLVVTALWYRGKDLLTPLAIKKIQHRLDENEFSEVIRHLDKMPGWMRKVFIEYQSMKPDDQQLVENLNSYYQG